MSYLILAESILDSYLKKIKPDSDTRTILSFFRKMGKHEGRVVYPSKNVGEWVYDLCWSVGDEEYEFKEEHFIELALESEWRTSWEDIAEDFYKLLDSKAPIKVGICQTNNRPKLLDKITNMISTFKIKIPSELYIIFIHGYGWEDSISGYIIDPKGKALVVKRKP